jgi:hypothetical protein
VLLEANFTKLADDQFLTSLAWVSLLYQGQSMIKLGLCLALVGALGLL